MMSDPKIAMTSVDEQWIADKLSEYRFSMEQLEALYPTAEAVALEWLARGDKTIQIDLVTGEMKRRLGRGFTNTMRPFFARLLRIRRPELRAAIEVTTTSRGRNRNVKVALDHLNVVAVVIEGEGGVRTTLELADVPAEVARLKSLREAARKRR